jgi:hypothetical protein
VSDPNLEDLIVETDKLADSLPSAPTTRCRCGTRLPDNPLDSR